MIKKTTQGEFNTFKREFLRWAEILNLKQYRYYFILKPLDDCFGQIVISEEGSVATVYLNANLDTQDTDCWEGPKTTAKHEAIHLLLHRLYWLGTERFAGSGELHHEWEHLTMILEKVIK